MHPLARLDQQYVWHPFTQMQDWLQKEPIVLVSGSGATLRDVDGREYLDANSSIWTNLHGHRQPQLTAALERQLDRVAHTSALGFANQPASELAAGLIRATRRRQASQSAGASALTKVFFSDNGSTAIEVALKLAYEHSRRSGRHRKPRFLSLKGAYHGDTVGATSLGHVDLFHAAYRGLLFKTDAVMAPYCYRCPFNRAQPEAADARTYRKCHWECVDRVERKFTQARKRGNGYAGFVYEPRIQGAAGMIAQPDGWLKQVTGLARQHGSLLIADEVLTGFGRTGIGRARTASGAPLFASELEGVPPDFLCLAKGLTGGYLPMAATLTTQAVFASFLGEYGEFRTFFHGHSYTANQLGAAAGVASLALLAGAKSFKSRKILEEQMTTELAGLWRLPSVGDIRQVGLIAGIELVRDRQSRKPFALEERAGIRVCEALSRRGVLTRPIGNVVVLMPPYCMRSRELTRVITALHDSILETLGK
jgi:adenosylmethionine-8-amino-7-oxononanoate transaminase